MIFTTLDRMLFYTFVRSYFIVWTSILSLYVVVDLFTNIDDFSGRGEGIRSVINHIAGYYGYRISQIFDKLAEVITLLGAMFTVSWMQRNNELLPQLSAGIPTRRVLRPGGQVWGAAHGPAHLRATWAALGQPLAPGDTPPEPALTVKCPITVTGDDARFLLGTYGQAADMPGPLFPVQDAAQLLIWSLAP